MNTDYPKTTNAPTYFKHKHKDTKPPPTPYLTAPPTNTKSPSTTPQNQRPCLHGTKRTQTLSYCRIARNGIGFSIALYADYMNPYYLGWTWTTVTVFSLILTASFLIHEVMHKVTAQKRGMWAEFRLTTWGSLLTLASVILPFKFISPGAVMISGNARLKDIGEISIAGPSINMILCAGFLGGALFSGTLEVYSLCILAAFINATIAIINLIPFGILDGYKIFSWNRKIWAASFAVAIALAIPSVLMVYGLI